MALTDDLISFWELEEASGTRVDAHGSNDLTEVNGPVGRVAGAVGFGADFELDSLQALTIADNPSLSLGTDTAFTFCGWMTAETLTHNQALCGKWTFVDLEDIEYIVRIISTGRAQLLIGNATTFSLVQTAEGVVSAGVRFFIVAWHDPATDVIAVQVNDGTPVTDPWAGGTFNGGEAFYLGDIFTPGASSNGHDGLIDQVGFWKRVPTTDERTFLYNGGNGRSYADFAQRRWLLTRTP